MTVDDLRFDDVDLLCMAVPSRSLPAAVESIRARIPADLGVLVLSKGLLAPDGTPPTRLVAERTGERPVACLGGPAHAGDAVRRGANVTVASPDRPFAALLASSFRRAGLACDTSTDLVGVELAGAAKNAAALAAGAALSGGPNAAGAAAGRVYQECHALADKRGASASSFTGTAGTGDLVATVLAAHSRNRRAGELLAQGVEPSDIPGILGQEPESLYAVPVLARAMREAGVRSTATAELAALAEGRIGPDQWVEMARRSRAGSRAA